MLNTHCNRVCTDICLSADVLAVLAAKGVSKKKPKGSRGGKGGFI